MADRTKLKTYFEPNDIPTANQFADFIDSALIQESDGVFKRGTNPLTITAEGDRVSQQPVLHLYDGFDNQRDWRIVLNPRNSSTDPTTANDGFGLNDANGTNRFFIENGTGNVGIDTNQPQQKLHVNGFVQSQVVFFHAISTQTVRISDYNTPIPLSFSRVQVNVGQAYDGTTFTAPVAGLYAFILHGFRLLSDGDGWLHWHLFRNGEQLWENNAISWEPFKNGLATTTVVLPLAENDTVVLMQSGVGASEGQRSIFSGLLMTATDTQTILDSIR